jgi:hypothetical protein
MLTQIRVPAAAPKEHTNIYLVRSKMNGHPLSCTTCRTDHRYTLGFLYKQDAEYVGANVALDTQPTFVDVCRDPDTMQMSAAKIIKPTSSCMRHKTSTEMQHVYDFMQLPIHDQVSIGLVHQILDENPREIYLEIQTFRHIPLSTDAFVHSKLRRSFFE